MIMVKPSRTLLYCGLLQGTTHMFMHLRPMLCGPLHLLRCAVLLQCAEAAQGLRTQAGASRRHDSPPVHVVVAPQQDLELREQSLGVQAVKVDGLRALLGL